MTMEDAGFVPCPVSSGRVVVGGLFVANESDWVKWFVVEIMVFVNSSGGTRKALKLYMN